ncbi:hypothetical protein [Gloeocapsopsis dulcis]|uniref:Uncharacterized protein n=1 Tax=Gloeocapsopsis dulcis AAB1 = 1H9 TaxID=1433147 RepID=A0A6N8FY60_9CHRO|nr:hypothetical protein [Gloeocapsopsis dulcis]MUL37891.1 hypothetical protein [Gloeocapsopsis dulcis AAB1 = 1H9]WNN92302.1 hypothetical protein P0S91_25950 [Gloeocapsopsis dulcis]
MATMGKYCKAYSLKKLREFNQWIEISENTRKEKKEIDGQEIEVSRKLTDDDFFYLQENYIVTDGIFKDENIIFNNVTPEWQDFCHKKLGFEIPTYETVEVQASANPENSNF